MGSNCLSCMPMLLAILAMATTESTVKTSVEVEKKEGNSAVMVPFLTVTAAAAVLTGLLVIRRCVHKRFAAQPESQQPGGSSVFHTSPPDRLTPTFSFSNRHGFTISPWVWECGLTADRKWVRSFFRCLLVAVAHFTLLTTVYFCRSGTYFQDGNGAYCLCLEERGCE